MVVIYLEFDRVLSISVPFRLVKGLAGRCHINPDYYYCIHDSKRRTWSQTRRWRKHSCLCSCIAQDQDFARALCSSRAALSCRGEWDWALSLQQHWFQTSNTTAEHTAQVCSVNIWVFQPNICFSREHSPVTLKDVKSPQETNQGMQTQLNWNSLPTSNSQFSPEKCLFYLLSCMETVTGCRASCSFSAIKNLFLGYRICNSWKCRSFIIPVSEERGRKAKNSKGV